MLIFSPAKKSRFIKIDFNTSYDFFCLKCKFYQSEAYCYSFNLLIPDNLIFEFHVFEIWICLNGTHYENESSSIYRRNYYLQ